MDKKERKKWFRGLVFVIVIFVVLFQTGNLLRRTAKYGSWNSSIKIGGFSNVEENSIDVMFYGSSHAYTSFIPNLIEEETGLKSYVFASQQQSIEMSYYYILESLKTQNPKTIVLETFMVNRSDEQPDESIVRSSLDFLPMSFNKLKMINAYAPKGKKHTYYFDLLKYHSRWVELRHDDFNFEYKKEIDIHKGYVFLEESQPVDLNPTKKSQINTPLNKKDKEYLIKIIDLADKEDIELIFVHAPYQFEENDVSVVRSINQFSDEHNVEFINMIEYLEELKLDETSDFYDSGHLNVKGASKLTKLFCQKFMK